MGYLITNRKAANAQAISLVTDTSGTVDIDITVYQSTDGDFHFDNSQTVSLSGGSGEENTLSGFTSSEDALYWAKIDITSGELSNLTIETDSDILISFDHESQWDSLQDFSGVSSSDVGVGRSSDSLTHGYEYGSLTDGIVGYWTFDNVLPDESNIAYDEALGNHGTINGATYTSGKIGQALSFDSSNNEYVNIGDPLTLQNGSSFTISGWFKFDNFSSEQGMVTQWDSNGNHGYIIRYSSSNSSVQFYIEQSSTNNAMCEIPDSNIVTGTWYHFTGVSNGKVGNTYIHLDGGSVTNSASFDGTYSGTNIDASIGLYQAGSSYLDGDADDVRIYDRALSLPEVQALYNRTKPHMINVSDTL